MSWRLWLLLFFTFFTFITFFTFFRTTDYFIVLPNVSINIGKEIGIGIKNKLTCLRVLFLWWLFLMCFLLLILYFKLLFFILYLGLLHSIVHFGLTSSVLHIWLLLYFLLNHFLWLNLMRSGTSRWRLNHALHLSLKIIHLLAHNL